MSRRFGLLVPVISALAVACGGEAPDAAQLRQALRAQVGDSADPEIEFARGPRHLTVRLHGLFFGSPESEVDSAARHIAGLVVRGYGRANELDSVTVAFIMVERGSLVAARMRSFDARRLD